MSSDPRAASSITPGTNDARASPEAKCAMFFIDLKRWRTACQVDLHHCTQPATLATMIYMQIEFLGTGGAIATPVPGMLDPLNVKARTLGVPYSRFGPCIYVHGPELLIDTPEEARLALDRANI